MNEAGPTTEPWATLALILAMLDVTSVNFVMWPRSRKYSKNQLYMWSGISRDFKILAKVSCQPLNQNLKLIYLQ